MREIKFRVFDKQTKNMHVVGTNQHDDLTCFGGVVEYYNLQNGEGSGEYGDYILMEYTGLKDKHGQEIYEGDVIEFYDNKGFLAEVVYRPPSFCLKWLDPRISKLRRLHSGIEPILSNIDIIGAVVGNVYEHAHLLERFMNEQ